MAAGENRVKTVQRDHGRGFGRMLVISLVLHTVLFMVLSGVIAPHFAEVKKPVYQVDLLTRPVSNPRSGRRNGRRHTQKKTVKKPAAKRTVHKKKPPKAAKKVLPKKKPPVKKTKLVTSKKKTAPPKKAVVKERVIKKPQPKSKPKPRPKPQPKIRPRPVETVDTSAAIERIRNRQRIADLKKQLAALAHDTTPVTGTTRVPVGISGGRGNRAGVDFDSWIKGYLSRVWVLPPHYLNRGLKARMELRFDSAGHLVRALLVTPSGDSFFDASVRRAVEHLRQLPSPPRRPMELPVTFDPKEMLTQ